MKNEYPSITDKLHAFADGQLESREREEVITLLENDPELRAEMCDIHRIKDLVKTAYPLDNFKQKPVTNSTYNNWTLTKVASYLLAFVLTFTAGYVVRGGSILLHENSITLGGQPIQEDKVILFLSSSEPEKFIKALAKAEALAKKFHHTEGKVYVVTSAEGVDLLRLKTSPYKHQIKELTNLYSSLHFVACNNSLYQFKKAGKPVELVDSAEVAPSAVEFIVKHLQQGWQYIAI